MHLRLSRSHVPQLFELDLRLLNGEIIAISKDELCSIVVITGKLHSVAHQVCTASHVQAPPTSYRSREKKRFAFSSLTIVLLWSIDSACTLIVRSVNRDTHS